jgi:imidazolonepropionase-like amidohydrolase
VIRPLLPLALAALAPAAPAPLSDGDAVALKAGTIHLVEDGQVLEGGATVLVRAGKIVAVGQELALPPDVRVVDYGPNAVIAPGLVAANSSYAFGAASQRTADPSLRAVDSFDPYSQAWLYDATGGVTTAYVAPARGRLIAGQGAVIKLGGKGTGRVVSESASIHGTIGEEARSVPGYWEPPVPATVDVGLGVVQNQLPRTTMGAILALRELLTEARGGESTGEYGPRAAGDLAELMRAGTRWRIGADSETEIRAILGLASDEDLPLVLDGATAAGGLTREIADAGASVVVKVDLAPEQPGRDFGKRRDDRWPEYGAAARLMEAGIPTAIATPDRVRARELRFAAAVASRGGLDRDAALHAITLGAAEVLGVDDTVGSLAVGKDADFVVLNGHPMDVTATVLATWIDGDLAWKATAGGGSGSRAVVIEADELHVGDGTVHRPGQVLIVDGRIAEVGPRVGHPMGAVVARGAVAMPGMIDALGHLGMDGSSKVPGTDFKLTRIVEPGDYADRRVAKAGVTTVVLAPRGPSKTGAPMMAYKPAGDDVDEMVIEDPAALRLFWTNPRNRIESGEDVTKLLEKVVEYDKKWKEYDAAMAAWVPPPAEPAKDEDEDEDEGEAKKDEDESEEDEDDSKKKKKRKKGDDVEEGDPLTGVWESDVVVPPYTEPSKLKLRLKHGDGSAAGTLRCDALSKTLVMMAGRFEDDQLSVSGLGSKGFVHVTGKTGRKGLEGTIRFGAAEIEFTAERTSKEYVEVKRPELRKDTAETAKDPKGKPKKPNVDEKLEPLRAALRGEKSVVVDVDREPEILECVDAFERAGIRPVLYGADDAWRVTDELRGRVAGVLLSHRVLATDADGGLSSLHNRYQRLTSAGIPVAFHSAAEEGASELWLQVSYAMAQGLSPSVALRSVTADSAAMMGIDDRVGRLAVGLDGDVLLLDGPPLDPSTSVLRAWVSGDEVR